MHWSSLVSAYASSPYFAFYRDDIHPFYEKKYKYLFDFNEALREEICALLNLEPRLEYSKSYTTGPETETLDYRELIHPKKQRLEELLPGPYVQVFDRKFGFLPDLSVLDLLFNTGPEASLFLMHKQ